MLKTAVCCSLVYPAQLVDLRLSHPLQCSLLQHEGISYYCVRDILFLIRLASMHLSGAQCRREDLQVERDASLNKVKATYSSMTDLQVSMADQLQQLQADLSTVTAAR